MTIRQRHISKKFGDNMRRKIAIMLLLAVVVGIAINASEVKFGKDGLTVAGLRPGTRIAWLALTRERIDNHGRLTVSRGIGVATPAGVVSIGRDKADTSRSIWAFATTDDSDLAIATVSPAYSATSRSIDVVAKPGDGRFTVVAPSVEIVYVGRRNGVWYATAADGGSMDADQSSDASITFSLDSLQHMFGPAKPPARISAGDVILIIDTRSNRKRAYEVGK